MAGLSQPIVTGEELGQHPPHRRRELYESRREREFYRYYEPIRELTNTGPQLCDLHNAEAVKAHLPFSAPDRALTAFCQLGALRLGARRAMMFFFDTNYAYILAEATQTLSLQDDSVHDIEDVLWLGHSKIPRGFSVCEHTAELPANSGSNKHDTNAGIIHIINDLTGDVRFCDRPYVTGGPLARFYAGVPITTPRGINIGAYCILDDKPRSGLDDKETAFLIDMAATIMTHLEMVRSTSNHKRSTRMVAGLSAFIDGASDTQDEENIRKSSQTSVAFSTSAVSRGATSILNTTPPVSGPPNQDIMSQAPAQQPVPTHLDSPFPTVPSPPIAELETPPPGSIKPPEVHGTRATLAYDSRAERYATNIKGTFDRVSGIVREAVEVDGAAFLDASVPSLARLVDVTSEFSSSERNSDSGMSEASDTARIGADHSSRTKRSTGQPKKDCYLLGSSIDTGLGRVPPNTPLAVPEQLLHDLLRRYPRGKIWNFVNDEGDASSEDDSSGSSISERLDGSQEIGPSPGSPKERVPRKGRRKRTTGEDGREVQRLFPGVRSLAIIGLWDQSKERWFAGCLIWTYSPFRVLSEECELSFMTAFADTIMAEVHRLESENANKAKMDFISSISHELRSPLHGILGSVECIQEQPPNADVTELVSQVEVCGRTLLDIVNHLLDFSKINTFAKAQDRGMHVQHGKTSLANHTETALDAEVSLDTVTEEVTETAFYSFCCSRDPRSVLNQEVAFILDIDRSIESHWNCRVDTGAWKRICMNVISNALKYTTKGYVHVSLKSAPSRHRKKLNAVLTVSDTGRGMSDDFLTNYLFKAFSQEDSLVDGTGLGMSLVAKIVKTLRGKVDVRSTKSIGTTVTITLPLLRGNTNPQRTEVNNFEARNTSIGVLHSATSSLDSTPCDAGKALLLASVKRTCSEIGLTHYELADTDNNTPDIALILESDFILLQERTDREDVKELRRCLTNVTDVPWIVLCKNAISQRQMTLMRPTFLSARKVIFTSQPCGPTQLARVVQPYLPDNARTENRLGAALETRSDMANTSYDLATTPSQLETKTLTTSLIYHKSDARPHRRWLSDNPTALPEEASEVPVFPIDAIRHTEPGSGGMSPLAPVEVGKSFTAEEKLVSRASSTQPSDNDMCLLLVDDNQINLQLLVMYAKKRKYPTIAARNGLEAVSLYKSSALSERMKSTQLVVPTIMQTKKPNVVLMDLNMPVLDGFEASRQIRQYEHQERLEPATIIALTGLGSAEAQQRAYSSGVDLFLTKPVHLKELGRVLERMKEDGACS